MILHVGTNERFLWEFSFLGGLQSENNLSLILTHNIHTQLITSIHTCISLMGYRNTCKHQRMVTQHFDNNSSWRGCELWSNDYFVVYPITLKLCNRATVDNYLPVHPAVNVPGKGISGDGGWALFSYRSPPQGEIFDLPWDLYLTISS